MPISSVCFVVIENKFWIILVTDSLSRFFYPLSKARIAEYFIDIYAHDSVLSGKS